MLGKVGDQRVRLSPEELTAFASMKGERFVGGLMVVGRAPNRWAPCFTPNDLRASAVLNLIVDKTLQSSKGENDKCPMLWVSDLWGNKGNREDRETYNTAKSAFWRVTRAVAGALGVADTDKPSWPTYLAWSNLYRVAPHSGGNPSASLCRAQKADCIDLLEAEIAEWMPK
jgi:hypothetical protein